MQLQFTKMHGLGNDYVYVNTFTQTVDRPEQLAPLISDRHRGVGSDGLILVAPPDLADAHVRMIMFNADGSRAQMCGNGVRCVAKYAYDRGLARHNPLAVQTDRGVLWLELRLNEAGLVETVRVDMGEPILIAADIPTTLRGDPVMNQPLNGLPFKLPPGTCVSMGNPHVVFYVDRLVDVPLPEWGPAIEHHAAFPQRVNAHFVEVVRRDHVRMATWERGAGPTQACGTGAAAVCVAGVLTGRTDRRMRATLPGGDLELEWREADNHVCKSGPAAFVFDGVWFGEA